MNVAIFTDNDFAKVNGVTTSLRAVLRYAPDGIRPRIYTASEFGEERPQYLALRSLGVRIPFYGEMRMYWPRLWRYLSQARRDRIDAIHLTTPGPVGLAALFVASRAGLPMVGSFHTDLAACAGRLSGSARLGTLMREYMRWTYGRCSRVLAPSENTRTLLIEAKIPADRIGVWRRGVDARMFSPARRSVALRERWGAGGRRPILLYVGRISKEKGLDLLPALQTALHRRGSAHRLVLVGDGPLRPTLERALPDAIFMGSQSPAGVADAMASADLFVFPSDTDSAGNVVLEAQSCGLPVFVSSAGGPREYIQDGQTGIVCRAGDAGSFGHEAARLLSDPVRRREMAERARAHALTLTWEAALAPLYDAYRGASAPAAHTASPDAAAPAAENGAAA